VGERNEYPRWGTAQYRKVARGSPVTSYYVVQATARELGFRLRQIWRGVGISPFLQAAFPLCAPLSRPHPEAE
jgi:hypothetical protein